MADFRSMPARGAVAPAQTLTRKASELGERLLSNRAFCSDPRSFAGTRRFSFGYQQLMHKNCGQHHSSDQNSRASRIAGSFNDWLLPKHKASFWFD
jgi:hypothetical protein